MGKNLRDNSERHKSKKETAGWGTTHGYSSSLPLLCPDSTEGKLIYLTEFWESGQKSLIEKHNEKVSKQQCEMLTKYP